MPCEMCNKRGKTWEGGDPECAFENNIFSSENWNCATVNAIRDICYEGQNPMPEGVDYRYCYGDQKYATIFTDYIEGVGIALWVSWYKNRGGTDAMWVLDEEEPPSQPTEEQCLKIIEDYKNKIEKRW